MIVDDDADVVAVIEKELENYGFEVIGFTDPLQALQQLRKNPHIVDLVVSDARMANMTGFQLARTIKKTREDMSVILISAFEISKNEFDKVLPSTHVDGFLTKPFHVSELVEVIKQLD